MRQSRTSAAHRRTDTLGTVVRIAASRFSGDTRGALMVVYALILPLLVALVGGVLDCAHLSLQKARLQAATDAAAVAAAREIHLVNTDKVQLNAVVKSVLLANLGDNVSGLKVSTSVGGDPLQVDVDVKSDAKMFILDRLIGSDGALSAHAAARPVGSTSICVLGLDESFGGTISLTERARLTGNGCAVYSNSARADGIKAGSGAELKAELICSVGGTAGSSSSFEPEPITDCPKMDDPLADRPAPTVAGCDYKDFMIGTDNKHQANVVSKYVKLGSEYLDEKSTSTPETEPAQELGTGASHTLKPGVYCGGLTISGGSRVKLSPGVYIMKDGPLWVDQGSVLNGDYVGFYFTGWKATLSFGPNTMISLRAPKDGPMAGLLIYEDPNSWALRAFTVLSDNARVLEGTIYLPKGYLYVDADRPIADKSAYTAIVARRLSLFAGPNLVLNTDYDQTDVPVPDGIGQSTGAVIVE